MYDEGGWTFPFDMELERPARLEPNIPHTLKVFVQDSILLAYLDGQVALDARMCAVSYTHLDVYKRQMLDIAYNLKARNAKRIFTYATYAIFTNGLASFDKAYQELSLIHI